MLSSMRIHESRDMTIPIIAIKSPVNQYTLIKSVWIAVTDYELLSQQLNAEIMRVRYLTYLQITSFQRKSEEQGDLLLAINWEGRSRVNRVFASGSLSFTFKIFSFAFQFDVSVRKAIN